MKRREVLRSLVAGVVGMPTLLEKVSAEARAVWRPPPKLKPSEFADEHLIVTTGPLAGTRWKTQAYQRGIVDAFEEPGVEEVVVKGSSQWGKTSVACVLVSYHMVHDPCPIMVVSPTEDPMAKDFSRRRIDPMIRTTPVLAAVVDPRRTPEGSNTALSKTFRGGTLDLPGANSAPSLAARSVRVLILDEIDRFPLELGKEGSTLEIAIRRTLTYGARRRILKLSSPTITTAPIHQEYLRGDQRKFFVPCPACADCHPLRWEDVTCPDGDPDLAHFVCPACQHDVTEAERMVSVDLGEWRATATAVDPSIVSFHLWAGYAPSPLVRLSQLARESIKAQKAADGGDLTVWRTFRQTALGEAIDDDGAESPTVQKLRSDLLARREDSTTWNVPTDVRVVASADVHSDRIEVLVTAWSDDEAVWLLDHQTLAGKPDEETVWTALEAFRIQTFGGHHIERLDIDSGYLPHTVYNFVMTRQGDGVFAVKGYADRPLLSARRKPERGPKGRKCLLFLVGTDEAKSLVMARLQKATGPGAVHLPRRPWCDEEFVAQLTSEQIEIVRTGSQLKKRWVQLRDRNEALDLLCYATHAHRWLPTR